MGINFLEDYIILYFIWLKKHFNSIYVGILALEISQIFFQFLSFLQLLLKCSCVFLESHIVVILDTNSEYSKSFIFSFLVFISLSFLSIVWKTFFFSFTTNETFLNNIVLFSLFLNFIVSFYIDFSLYVWPSIIFLWSIQADSYIYMLYIYFKYLI